MGIDNYMGKTTTSLTDRLSKLTKEKSNEEKRKIEMELAKPDTLPPYGGELPGSTTSVHERTIKIVAKSSVEMELITKYFKIASFKEKNIRDLDLLICVLLAMEDGHLKYDNKEKKLYYISDQDEEVLL